MDPKLNAGEEGSDNSSNGDEYDQQSINGWIQWFCMMEGNSFFCEIDEEYIVNSFNLYGIKHKIETDKLKDCLDLILSPTNPTESDMQDSNFLQISQEATEVYGMIHARFILTTRGMALMYQKYMANAFGVCPRVQCEKQPTLPIGISDEPRTSRVKVNY